MKDYNSTKEWIPYTEILKRAGYRMGARPYDVRRTLLRAIVMLGRLARKSKVRGMTTGCGGSVDAND
uniref:hypothetical protein n=1 Tax=Geminicoccus harenae TaxID=2498453 RepID=UPI001C96E161